MPINSNYLNEIGTPEENRTLYSRDSKSRMIPLSPRVHSNNVTNQTRCSEPNILVLASRWPWNTKNIVTYRCWEIYLITLTTTN